jgi:hypothetical protein
VAPVDDKPEAVPVAWRYRWPMDPRSTAKFTRWAVVGDAELLPAPTTEAVVQPLYTSALPASSREAELNESNLRAAAEVVALEAVNFALVEALREIGRALWNDSEIDDDVMLDRITEITHRALREIDAAVADDKEGG